MTARTVPLHHNIPANPAHAESDRLRPLFLAYVGQRPVSAVARQLGFPPRQISAWTGGRTPLPPWLQAHVRALLGDRGGAP